MKSVSLLVACFLGFFSLGAFADDVQVAAATATSSIMACPDTLNLSTQAEGSAPVAMLLSLKQVDGNCVGEAKVFTRLKSGCSPNKIPMAGEIRDGILTLNHTIPKSDHLTCELKLVIDLGKKEGRRILEGMAGSVKVL